MLAIKSFFKFQLLVFLGLLAAIALLDIVILVPILTANNLQYKSVLIAGLFTFIDRFIVSSCAPFVFLIGVPAYFLVIRSKAIHRRKWYAAPTALVGVGVAFVCYPIIDQCEMSSYAKHKIMSTLTDEEKFTLIGYADFSDSPARDAFCPVNFIYTKDGERLASTVMPDVIHGPKIFTESLAIPHTTSSAPSASPEPANTSTAKSGSPHAENVGRK